MSEPRYRTIGDHVAAVLARVGPRTPSGRAREARLGDPRGAVGPVDPVGPVGSVGSVGPGSPVAAWLPLDDAAVAGPGLVLADDVVAVWPVPGFDHAAVDGYAVRLADVPVDGPVTLQVVGAVRAGEPGIAGLGAGPGAGPGLGAGQAVRVMTGAPVPPGADAVVPVEATSTSVFTPGVDGTESAVTLTRPRKDNVRRRGEDVAAGVVLRARGQAVSPALIAAAAAAGVTGLDVRYDGARPAAPGPRVAVISTGSELRPAGARLGAGGIVDSNSLMIAAIVRAAGAEPVRRGGVPDDAAALRAALDEVAPGVDLIVTTGGVSAGAWDVVRQVLTTPGTAADVDLTGVAMRPGRPQALAEWRGVPWIALPGTPVAAFVAAHLFVRPAVAALCGAPSDRLETGNVVAGSASWPAPGAHGCGGSGAFTRIVPVRAVAGTGAPTVVPTAGAARGGHALSALLDADALALVPPGGTRPGDPLEVVPL